MKSCLCPVMMAMAVYAATGLHAQPPAPPPEGVEKHAVVIWSEGTRLAADLYLPNNRKRNDRLPTIVLCNGWGGVKQGVPERLGARLAQNGFIALAFDYRGWGESDCKLVMKGPMPKPDTKGEVTVRAQAIRQVVDPLDEAQDIRHVIDYLMGEPGIDTGRIGLWGSSYGGGLVTWVAAQDPRVKCVVAQVAGMGVMGEAARKKGRERGTQQARAEIGPIPQDYDKSPKLPGYANLAKMADYNALAVADKIAVPILYIDAEKEELMDRRENGQKAYEIIKAKGNVPTEYHVVKGITHFQIYREGFEEAAGLALDWFTEHLKRGKVKTQ